MKADEEIAERLARERTVKATFIERAKFGGDPVVFLINFLTMRRDPQRAQIGFDHKDLQWVADVFEQAEIVSRGDERFAREKRKFQKLTDEVKTGLLLRKETVAITLLESHDWPSKRTIVMAAQLLANAEVRGIH